MGKKKEGWRRKIGCLKCRVWQWALMSPFFIAQDYRVRDFTTPWSQVKMDFCYFLKVQHVFLIMPFFLSIFTIFFLLLCHPSFHVDALTEHSPISLHHLVCLKSPVLYFMLYLCTICSITKLLEQKDFLVHEYHSWH